MDPISFAAGIVFTIIMVVFSALSLAGLLGVDQSQR